MMATEIHKGDIGTVFQFTVKDQDGTAVDISSQTTMNILFIKPDGTTLTKAGSFTTDGINGKFDYTILSGELDTVGNWKWQAEIVITSGSWKSDQHEFEVHPNIV